MITSARRHLYFSPDDDAQSAVLAEIVTARREIRVQMYAFTLAPIVDLLIQRHQEGVVVALVLDASQAQPQTSGIHSDAAAALALEEISLGGNTESSQIQRLKDAGVPLAIGNSRKGGLLHEKACVIDEDVALYGSWNWTLAASKQTNHLIVDRTSAIVAAFVREWWAQWQRLTGVPQ